MQQPISGVQQPISGVQQPISGVKQPISGVKQPKRGVKQPSSGVKQPSSGGQQSAAQGNIHSEKEVSKKLSDITKNKTLKVHFPVKRMNSLVPDNIKCELCQKFIKERPSF